MGAIETDPFQVLMGMVYAATIPNISLTAGDWFLIAAVAVGLSYLIGKAVNDSPSMKQRNITAWGPVIFLRTGRGQRFLDRLASHARLWRFMITAGVPLVVAGMLLFFLQLLLMNYLMILAPPEPGDYNAPRNILLIPGINQYIPLVWGWIALIITMLVHEFAHGIMARVEGIRIKSMGVILMLFPVGAFVEPDEEELFGSPKSPPLASRAARIRILSAGVIANFLVAAISMALLFGPVIGAISPVERGVVSQVENGSAAQMAGFQENMILEDFSNLDSLEGYLKKGDVGAKSEFKVMEDGSSRTLYLEGQAWRGISIFTVFAGSPAQEAGMPDQFVITSLNGTPTRNLTVFRTIMNNTNPGQSLIIGTTQGEYKVMLADKGDGTGLIGVGISGDAIYLAGATFQQFNGGAILEDLQSIPSQGLLGLYRFMALPFAGLPGITEDGFQGFSGWISQFFQATGWAEPLGGKIFWITNLLLWTGWLNLYVGLFNCLPAIPLDGGHIFRDLLRSAFQPFIRDGQKADLLTARVVTFMAWLIFSSLVFTILAPYLAHGVPV